ncbi:MAG: hypothetical protein RLO50_16575 [Azospirillaceae bacterium]
MGGGIGNTSAFGVSRRVARGALATGVLALIMAGGAAAQSGRMIELNPPTPQARFVDCMTTAGTDPPAAIALARDWEVAGGGTLARECEAAALALDGRERLAASRYVGLGEEIGSRDAVYATGLYVEAARLWREQDEPMRAVAALDAAIDLMPMDPGLFLARARLRQTSGDPWGALEDLWRASELAPGRADILLLRAAAHREAGLPDLAISDLDQALAHGGAAGEILLERARLKLRVGDVAGARADLEAVIARDPDSISAEIAEAELVRLDGAEGS